MLTRSTFWSILGVSLIVAATLGRSLAAEVKTEEAVTGVKVVVVDKYIRAADNFIILYDASGSMARPYEETGMTMIQAAAKALKEKNAPWTWSSPCRTNTMSLFTSSAPRIWTAMCRCCAAWWVSTRAPG
jgi:hypothetical protein